MKRFYFKYKNDHSIDKVVRRLNRSMRKGDIILSAPIPKTYYSRFINMLLLLSRRILHGVTHSCVYLGEGRILDIDFKLVRSGPDIYESTIADFVRSKLDYAGGVIFYVVKPKHYTKYHRQEVVAASMKQFLGQRNNLSHSYIGSIVVGLRYVFMNRKRYKEDLTFRTSWTCSHMVAYLLKIAGAKIGKRASYTYVPPHFLKSKHFMTKSKIVFN